MRHDAHICRFARMPRLLNTPSTLRDLKASVRSCRGCALRIFVRIGFRHRHVRRGTVYFVHAILSPKASFSRKRQSGGKVPLHRRVGDPTNGVASSRLTWASAGRQAIHSFGFAQILSFLVEQIRQGILVLVSLLQTSVFHARAAPAHLQGRRWYGVRCCLLSAIRLGMPRTRIDI